MTLWVSLLEEAEAIAQAFKNKFSGANRGAPMIMTGAMDVDILSFTPNSSTQST